MEPTFLTVSEAAKLAGVSRVTMLRAIHKGTVKALRLGGRGMFRIPKDDFLKLVGLE